MPPLKHQSPILLGLIQAIFTYQLQLPNPWDPHQGSYQPIKVLNREPHLLSLLLLLLLETSNPRPKLQTPHPKYRFPTPITPTQSQLKLHLLSPTQTLSQSLHPLTPPPNSHLPPTQSCPAFNWQLSVHPRYQLPQTPTQLLLSHPFPQNKPPVNHRPQLPLQPPIPNPLQLKLRPRPLKQQPRLHLDLWVASASVLLPWNL